MPTFEDVKAMVVTGVTSLDQPIVERCEAIVLNEYEDMEVRARALEYAAYLCGTPARFVIGADDVQDYVRFRKQFPMF